jgi:hypothetical protein
MQARHFTGHIVTDIILSGKFHKFLMIIHAFSRNISLPEMVDIAFVGF